MYEHSHFHEPSAGAKAAPVPDIEDFGHTGPGTLAGRFLRRFWQPAYLSKDLEPGWSKPVQLLGQDFTLYRSEAGQAFAVGPRCAHRNVQLSVGMVEGDCIRCPYHGWKYDGSGQCVEQPAEKRPFSDKVRIPSYPVREYLGLIFVYLGEGEAPEMPCYPAFEAETGVVYNHNISWPFNYFQHLENAVDEAHISFLHDLSPYKPINFDVPEVTAEETGFGLVQRGTRSNSKARETFYHMPNMTSWAMHPLYPEETAWREWMSWRVPVDDYNHLTIGVAHAYVAEGDGQSFFDRMKADFDSLAQLRPTRDIAKDILAGRMRWQDVELRGSGADMTMIQDYVAQVGQGTLTDRTTETLGASDNAIRLLRKIWRRELRALKNGEAMTNWEKTIPRPVSGI